MKTIALQLTSPGTGAIAVIALAGENSPEIIHQLLSKKSPSPIPIGKTLRATLIDPRTNAPLDDALILRLADDHFEIHIHGGIAVVDALLAALKNAGAEKTSIEHAASLGVFGKSLHAEILTTLPAALTMTAASLIAAQESEGLHAWASRWATWLKDKSPNDLWQLHSATQWLLQRSATLKKLLHPPRIAIVGPPNAGKSTLANALLGRPIAITSDTPGTTRDWIDALATFTHQNIAVPVTLVDTAGIRETTDALEQLAIDRTHGQAAQANLLLFLFDASQPLSPQQQELLISTFSGVATQRLNAPYLIVANKIDAGTAALCALERLAPRVLQISAKNQTHLDALMSAALAKLDLAQISLAEPFAFTTRQTTILEQLALTTHPTTAAMLLQSLIS